jgi:hypothetical protein
VAGWLSSRILEEWTAEHFLPDRLSGTGFLESSGSGDRF